jgi:hypothetical protein
MKRALIVALLLSAPAYGFELGLPVTCAIGKECFIQNYVDEEPGGGYKDYTCGSLSYPGHKGTDFRIPTTREMMRRAEVVAAADGTVRATRDGMEDRLLSEKGAEAVKGRECGNSVAITHADGWETMYCHLRKGSVQVKKGDRVTKGQRLGLIGLSGSTEFPHVHLQVNREGRIIDPFTGGGMETACGQEEANGLWDARAQEALRYRSGGFVTGGFASAMPDLSGITKGQFHEHRLDPAAPMIVFWAESYGLRGGDQYHMTLTGPDGKTVAEIQDLQPHPQAVTLRLIGRKNSDRLPEGTYRGTYRVTRQGMDAPVAEFEDTVEVK